MIDITSKEELKNILTTEEKIVVVDLWAPWCGPCKMLTPTLEKLENENSDKVFLAKVNVDDNSDIANEYNVRSIPTVLFYKNNEVVNKVVGVKNINELTKIINEINS